jgi:hypothetical protein
MKRLALAIMFLACTTGAQAAWNATFPANDTKLKDTPIGLRANWAAIALGTDAALTITNAKVDAAAAINNTKLDTIYTAGKVNSTAIVGLSSMAAGAGALPIANGGTAATTATAAVTNILPAQTTNNGKALITNNTTTSWGYPAGLNITSQAQGDLIYYNATWQRLGAGTAGQVLTTGGAGANPSWNTTVTSSLGAWSDVSAAGAHDNETAATDGFVVAAFSTAGSASSSIGRTGTGSPATQRCSVTQTSSSNDGFTMPVRKGEFWNVSTDAPSMYIYWIPLGN